MLPDGIPTVTVTGRFLTPEGEALSGQIVFRAPSLITLPDHDVILGGPVTEQLDAQGAFTVTLLATDTPNMNPAGWSYTVTEQLAGVATNRSYQILLPADVPAVDIADLAPTDPTTPTYVAVHGDSAYEVAVEAGFVGTVADWLASLVGPVGPAGSVDTVNGLSGPAVVLNAAAVGAVETVNDLPGPAVVLDAAAVGAVPNTAPGTPGGVATLDGTGKLTSTQAPDIAFVGESGRRYRLLSGALRNTGTGWSLISDASHEASALGAVTTTSTYVQVAHAVGGTRVSSLQATPDETFAAQGVRVGASVGLGFTRFHIYTEPADRISDRVFYSTTTSTWTSENGVFSGFAFSGGILTLTHADMGAGGSAAIGQRGTTGAFVGNLAPTTTQIVFYTGAFGSLTAATAPVNSMSCHITRFGLRSVPPAAPATVVSASGNFWITGLVEV